MKLKLIRLLLSINIVLTVHACGFMKEYFPDKEKDYQLTKEIPALRIPSDLSGYDSQSIKKDFSANNQEPVSQEAEADEYENTENQGNVSVDLITYSDKAPRIKITDTFVRSWRIVGKAISHHSIEITNRDVMNGVYFVQYDPDFKKVKDGSLWDEILFIFGADPAKEKEYRIKLVENRNVTDVIILDSEDKENSDESALGLLKLLYKTIKEDLAK